MAIKKVIDVEVKDNFSEATKHAKDFNKETVNTKKNLKGVTDVADKATGGMVSKFSLLTSVIGSVAKGFTTLKGAIIASGIGALALIISGVISAFRSSEEGQNKFAKLMGVIGAVVGNLVDLLSDFGEKVISVFENPKQAIKDFANLIKTNIVNRLNGILELVPKLGKAINQLFKGDFSGAAKTATDAAGKVALGMDSVTDSINNATKATKKFIEEQKREGKLAEDVANKRANADKIDRKLLVERARLEGDIAELKLKSRDIENYTAQERLKALKEAQVLEDKLLIKEQEALTLRYEAQKLENTFSRTDKENADKEAQAEANLLNIKSRRLDQQRATLREINRTNKEIAANAKAAAAEAKREADENLKLSKEKAQKELEIEQARLQKIAELNNALLSEIEKAENEYYDSKLSKQEQEERQVQDRFFNLIEQAKLNGQETAILEEAQQSALSEIKERYRIEEDNKNKESLEKTKKIEEAKFDAAKNTLGLISGIEELFANSSVSTQKKAFKIKKAADLASATLDGYRAVLSTYAQTPGGPLLKGIAAGVAGGFAALQISKISQSKFGGTESSFGGSDFGGGIPSTTESRAPQFNIVGQGGVGQAQFLEQKPVQAFVVSGEVTSQQALDRNRLRNATL